MEITSSKLFEIIGQQTVELAIVRARNQKLIEDAEALRRDYESLKNGMAVRCDQTGTKE